MHYLTIILLVLGFSTGVLLSTLNNEKYSSNQSTGNKTEDIVNKAEIDQAEPSVYDTILPLF